MEHDLERSPRSRNSVGSLGQNQNHRSTKASCNAGPSSRSSQAPSRTLRTLGPSRTFRAYCVRNGAMARPSLNTLITIAMATRTYFDEREIGLGIDQSGDNLSEGSARYCPNTRNHHGGPPLVHRNNSLRDTARCAANPDSLGIPRLDRSGSNKQPARPLAQNRHLLGHNSDRPLGSIRSRQCP